MERQKTADFLRGENSPSWIRRNLAETIIVVCGLCALNAIFLSAAFKPRLNGYIDSALASAAGDFIGGYFGTLFALLSIVLLVTTIKRQSVVFEKERFESHFFQLLSLQRENVSEMQLRSSSGRRVFSLLLDEFRCLHKATVMLAANQTRQFDQLDLVRISYYFFFLGVGPNSSRMVRSALRQIDTDFIRAVEDYLNHPAAVEKARIEIHAGKGYKPFQGHQHRLGHYYRHLYQSLKFIDSQSRSIDRYLYGKRCEPNFRRRSRPSCYLTALLLWETVGGKKST
jgi:hypothetical protein